MNSNVLVFDDQSTLYDVLEIKPDASSQEVREAYLRAKSVYTKDGLALYTLVTPQEREQILKKIEEAYEVLSNEFKRREYDRCHGLLSFGGLSSSPVFSTPAAPVETLETSTQKIVSIDRVPPMSMATSTSIAGGGNDNDQFLVAPPTDFGRTLQTQASDRPFDDTLTSGPATPVPLAGGVSPTMAPNAALAPLESDVEIDSLIANETEWAGATLRRLRELRKLSVEELSTQTKISKTYLLAIEDEQPAKLPAAAVFVRGFVLQVAKALRVPSEKVATGYMERYKKARA